MTAIPNACPAHLAAARRQITNILSDDRPHSWGEINRAVAMTHAVPHKAVSGILRDLIDAGDLVREQIGNDEPRVRLAAIAGRKNRPRRPQRPNGPRKPLGPPPQPTKPPVRARTT